MWQEISKSCKYRTQFPSNFIIVPVTEIILEAWLNRYHMLQFRIESIFLNSEVNVAYLNIVSVVNICNIWSDILLIIVWASEYMKHHLFSHLYHTIIQPWNKQQNFSQVSSTNSDPKTAQRGNIYVRSWEQIHDTALILKLWKEIPWTDHLHIFKEFSPSSKVNTTGGRKEEAWSNIPTIHGTSSHGLSIAVGILWQMKYLYLLQENRYKLFHIDIINLCRPSLVSYFMVGLLFNCLKG